MGRKPRFRLNWATTLVRLSVAALIAAVALFAASALLLPWRDGCGPTKIMTDQSRLRQIAALTVSEREIPMKDGAFDPYEFSRRHDAPYELFRSERMATGPTDEEIERGDYGNFPWERYRGDGTFKHPATFPVLWEKTPDRHGGVIVALSDGSVRYCEHEDFVLRRLTGLVVQSGRIPMKDGAFDPYQFVHEGLVPPRLMRHAIGIGPTDEEIARGDYAKFPWERYRGNGKLDRPPFPLLRARHPDEGGGILVGLSDGTVTRADPVGRARTETR